MTRLIHGKARALDIALAPLMDGSPDIRFILICVRDVTEQRALARQVLEQAERQAEAAELERALFQNSPDPLFIVRVEEEASESPFVYEAVSPAVEHVFGLRVESLVGHRLEACFPPAVRDVVEQRYRRCIDERTMVDFVETRDMPAGKRDFEGTLTPLFHRTTGRVVRLVGTVRDVTERNRLEAALRHSQKMQAIGRLAAGVAHDFNNILQAVIGGLEAVLDETEAGTPARDFAHMALRSATRGSYLTHHLLSYAHKQLLRPETINVAAFLPDIAETLLTRTLGPQIAIGLHVDGTPCVLADPGEFQTALLNLAINAAHAMPEGGSLQIDVKEEITSAEPWVRITVTDTGIGMDDATVAQAADPFFTTKGVGGGTGLGLSMVQGFVEQSGGTFHIASSLGQGTSVELRLPAVVKARLSAPPQLAIPLPRGGRILLVDDAMDVRVTVAAFLQKVGFSVTQTDSGDQALTLLLQGERFDALVTDYAMPGINGGDLISQGRLFQPGLAALIITGYAAVGEADTAIEAVTTLHKPFQRQELIDALLQVMAPSQQEEQTSATLSGST